MNFEDSKKIAEKALQEVNPRSLNKSLFNMANAYNRVADNSIELLFSSGNADFAAPVIMCKSFSIELLLKFFIAFNEHAKTYNELNKKVELKRHKYTDLFDKIPEEFKKIIVKHFSQISKKEMTVNNFRNSLIDIGNDPFVKWRYIYEEKETNHLNFELFDIIVKSLGLSGEEILKEKDF